MNRVEVVNSGQEWQEAAARLGVDIKGGIPAVAWQVIPNDVAQGQAESIASDFSHDRGETRANGNLLPETVLEASYDIASMSQRFPLSEDKKMTRRPAVFGISHDVTGLHVDIARENDVPLSPPYNTLYVASGVIRAYFRSLPLDMIAPPEENPNLDYLEDLEAPDPKTDNGYTIRPDKLQEFSSVDAPAGMLLAFPTAGHFERGIRPSAHQVETVLSEHQRYSIAISDVHFSKRIPLPTF